MPPLAARPLAAEISIIDLDPAFELGLMGLTGTHRPHQLVLHEPGVCRLTPSLRPSSIELISFLLWVRW